jgi:hypothetical protein
MPTWVSGLLLGLVALAVAAALVRGVGEKVGAAVVALSPWGDLSAWSGPALGYVPVHTVLGIPSLGSGAVTTAAVAAVLGLAVFGVSRLPRAAGLPFGALCAAGLLAAVYLRARSQTELFYFKTMGFTGPLVVAAAAVGIADLAGRVRATATPQRLAGALGVAALAGVIVASAVDVRREVSQTFGYVTPDVLELKRWSAQLPPGRSVRLDVPANGWQLWASYMLADRPLCTSRPFSGFFPSPPFGVRADYALTYADQPVPYGAASSTPLRRSRQFNLWALRPGLPGPDVCSRRMVDSITKITIA